MQRLAVIFLFFGLLLPLIAKTELRWCCCACTAILVASEKTSSFPYFIHGASEGASSNMQS